MNNEYIDLATGIKFILPFHRQLTHGEKQQIAQYVVEQEKDALFNVWRSRAENWNWNGDVNEKRSELFAAKNPAATTKLIPTEVIDAAMDGENA